MIEAVSELSCIQCISWFTSFSSSHGKCGGFRLAMEDAEPAADTPLGIDLWLSIFHSDGMDRIRAVQGTGVAEYALPIKATLHID